MTPDLPLEERLRVLRDNLPDWAPYVTHAEVLLARGTVDVIRAELPEPASLADLLAKAKELAPDVNLSDLRVEHRQKPDPSGEGSISFVALVQALPASDAQYEKKVDVLWHRYRRAQLAKQGIDLDQLELYRKLHAQFGHIQPAV